jgi:glycosyltransferase involved in cell wall biosynthesis
LKRPSTDHPQRVLFVTLEPVSARMAGPAIRALELAKQLSEEFEVTIFSPHGDVEPIGSEALGAVDLVTGLGKRDLSELAVDADILVIQANVLKPYPFLAQLNKFLVVDLYDPYLFTIHIQYENDAPSSSASYRLMHQVLERHMTAADFSICASERQRDYWIGRYCALGRIDPRMYRSDPSLRSLIDVVPFGLPEREPRPNGPGARQLIPQIGASDPLLIWGGGIWEWFDPLTLIEAVAELVGTAPNIRLVFMGTRSPNPQVPLSKMAVKAESLAESLGILDQNVFFPEEWVSYEQRVNYLLDADIAVSAHFDLPETRFSFRTRILDYFWCHLPIITTGGDSLADLIERSGAGITVPYRSVEDWKAAILRLLSDNELRRRCRTASAWLGESFTWNKVAEPLRQYCRAPHTLPKHQPVKMPSLIERAHAVYSRGGKDLVLKRSSELIKDILK